VEAANMAVFLESGLPPAEPPEARLPVRYPRRFVVRCETTVVTVSRSEVNRPTR
jgi:hypothetical protein